ncbi:MAG: hypothetical protein AB7O49_06140 [Sphingomonadales bacterium]
MTIKRKRVNSKKRGRPSGSRKTKTIVHEFAHRMHAIAVQGEVRQATTVEWLFRKLIDLAQRGSIPAAKEVERYRDKLGSAAEKSGIVIAPAEMSPEDWIKMATFQNQFRHPPDNEGDD